MINKDAVQTKEQQENGKTSKGIRSNLPQPSKDVIESAYAFFHQKQRIYQYSTLEWQKDDIEYAIDNYVTQMDGELYKLLANGRCDYLCNHTTFAEDIADAIGQLGKML